MSKFQLMVFRGLEYIHFLGKWQPGAVTSRNRFVWSSRAHARVNVTREQAGSHMVTLWLEGRFLQWQIWFTFLSRFVFLISWMADALVVIGDSCVINIYMWFSTALWKLWTFYFLTLRIRTAGVALQHYTYRTKACDGPVTCQKLQFVWFE